MAHDEMSIACRGYPKPSEAKTRATAQAIVAATGADIKEAGSGSALMEEVFNIMEKLKAKIPASL